MDQKWTESDQLWPKHPCTTARFYLLTLRIGDLERTDLDIINIRKFALDFFLVLMQVYILKFNMYQDSQKNVFEQSMPLIFPNCEPGWKFGNFISILLDEPIFRHFIIFDLMSNSDLSNVRTKWAKAKIGCALIAPNALLTKWRRNFKIHRATWAEVSGKV